MTLTDQMDCRDEWPANGAPASWILRFRAFWCGRLNFVRNNQKNLAWRNRALIVANCSKPRRLATFATRQQAPAPPLRVSLRSLLQIATFKPAIPVEVSKFDDESISLKFFGGRLCLTKHCGARPIADHFRLSADITKHIPLNSLASLARQFQHAVPTLRHSNALSGICRYLRIRWHG